MFSCEGTMCNLMVILQYDNGQFGRDLDNFFMWTMYLHFYSREYTNISVNLRGWNFLPLTENSPMIAAPEIFWPIKPSI